MGLPTTRCESCNTEEVFCPECRSTNVTPLDNPQTPKPTDVAAHGTADGRTLDYTNVCWDCGWREEVTVVIRRSSIP
jgi:hypothetical protein